MDALRRMIGTFLTRIERWGRARGREGLLEAHSTGPCPDCGQERIRVRDVRVDDLGYSVRVRQRWSCGCGDAPGAPAAPPDPSGPS